MTHTPTEDQALKTAVALLPSLANTPFTAFPRAIVAQAFAATGVDDDPALSARVVSALADALLESNTPEAYRLVVTLLDVYDYPQQAKAVSYMLHRDCSDVGDPRIRLVRRNRQIVTWSESKIESAVRRAFAALRLDSSPAVAIAAAVTASVKLEAASLVGIEDVQDKVQEELMRQGHYQVAAHYILYRSERAKHRTELPEEAVDVDHISIVSETPGGVISVPYDPQDIKRRIAYAITGLDLCLSKKEITKELLRSVGNSISAKDLKTTIILNAKTLLERDADFAKFSGRILLTYIYEEVLDWNIMRDGVGKLKKAHQVGFTKFLRRAVEIDRVDKDLLTRYDLGKLAKVLDPSADMDFEYLGVQTLYDRYLLVDKTHKLHVRLEVPQFFWMRVAMGLFKEEGMDWGDSPGDVRFDNAEVRHQRAVELYNVYKSRRFCSSTPTLFNSGTPHSQCSSCYLHDTPDSLTGIFQRGISDNAQLAKYAGGIGGSWSKIRGTGAHINGTNGESQGVIPFIKVFDAMLNSCNQGGKRKGSGAIYLATWHNDIEDFMELKKNVGDERRRAHDTNTAHWIPDLFMKRMEARAQWSLFRSNEVPDLTEIYGAAFERRYEEYEVMAAEGKIWSRVIPALDIWKQILKAIFETGHPWLCFQDPCNVRSPQDHCGVVHSSNLCCMTADQRVVTNLGMLTVGELYELQTPVTVSGRAQLEGASVMHLPRPNAPIVDIRTKEGYTHKVTPDHKVWVEGKGRVEAQHLVPGDLIELQKVGQFGPAHAPDAAFVMGLIAGNGTYGSGVRIDLWKGKTDHLRDEVTTIVAELIRAHYVPTPAPRPASVTPRFKDYSKKLSLDSRALAKALECYGFNKATKTAIPDVVWRGDRETVEAYLRGLYLTYATVAETAGSVFVALAQVDRELLRGVQLLWLNLGVKSTLALVRAAGECMLPDGKGASRLYHTKPLHKLTVSTKDGCSLVEVATGVARARGHEAFLVALTNDKRSFGQSLNATFVRLEELPNEDAYCVTVDSEEHMWTVNGMISSNTEITLNTAPDEIAVCNLGSVLIDEHLTDTGEIDHAKLEETVTIAVRALDNVIDINFYPVEATYTSNMRHRPIGLGMMGLQNALHRKKIAFASQEAVDFSDEFTEAFAYYAIMASSKLAKEKGTYVTYKGSKWDRGLLPQDTVALLAQERGEPIAVEMGGKLDWTKVRDHVAAHGMRNSNVMAIAPTATISCIMGTTPCVEPSYKNLFVKSNMSGDFTVLSSALVRELKELNLWGKDMLDQLKYYDGELEDIPNIPDDIKDRHRTVFGVSYAYIIDAAARRQKWIDQSQSLNLYLASPDMKTLSLMYRHAWRSGLKTTYYLRTMGASGIEKTTIDAGKELRGLVADAAAKACSIDAMLNGEVCESCQ